jgi:hypothetical protein
MIDLNEKIMRISNNHIYHLTCFMCMKCHVPLVKGDRYVIFNGQPFCERDNPFKSQSTPTSNKRGNSTSKRGAKAARSTMNVQVQQAQMNSSSQYNSTGQMTFASPYAASINSSTHSLINNSTIDEPTLTTNQLYG